MTISLSANTLHYPQGGGHFWMHMNWALGFRSLGCNIIWIEKVQPEKINGDLENNINNVQSNLKKFGFENSLKIFSENDTYLKTNPDLFNLEEAYQSDLLLNLRYDLPSSLIKNFKKSAFIDIDPGILQLFMAKGDIQIAPHDTYFTIGETIGASGSNIPTAGITWNYTAPCVDINHWTDTSISRSSAPFTTVSHWNANEWMVEEDGSSYSNDKRDGFLPYLDLPKSTEQILELAICLNGDDGEKQLLQSKGWQIEDSWAVADTPEAYKNYIENSKGEFSCAKPHCVNMQNAWISDRTLCYLASGKPAIVQHTGQSKFLPDRAGLLRFHSFNEAVKCIEEVNAAYSEHCRLARELAEEYFNAQKVTAKLLEKVL